MKILIGGYKSDMQYLGKLSDNTESIERVLDKVKEIGNDFDYDIKDVSNGTYESLEKGVITVDEI